MVFVTFWVTILVTRIVLVGPLVGVADFSGALWQAVSKIRRGIILTKIFFILATPSITVRYDDLLYSFVRKCDSPQSNLAIISRSNSSCRFRPPST
jgi:hypothetical protein